MRTLLTCLLLVQSSLAQEFVITTIAGADFVFRGDGEPARQAQLSQIYQVLADPQGNVLIVDRENHQIVQVSTLGILKVIAGNGIAGFSGDGGPATRASLNFPSAVAVDAAGNLYVADAGNRRVRRVSRDGVIVTVVGNGNKGVGGDGGPATAAQLDNPSGLAIDRAGSLYVSDDGAHRVRRVSSNGIISSFAGNGTPAFSGDGGPALQASVNAPRHLVVDTAGNLLIAEFGNNRVRRVTPQGTITTVAGNGRTASSGDGGQAVEASLIGPTGIHIDGGGTLYIAEFFNRVRAVAPNGVIRTFAGGDKQGFAGDGGGAANAQLSVLTAVSGDGQGNIYIADSVNLRVRRVNGQGIIDTIAGAGQFRYSGDGGLAVSASLAKPYGLAVDGEGNIYVSDSDNHRVRRIDPRGVITTFAGTGPAGFAGDGGPANRATLNFPLGLAVDAAGNLYISDLLNGRVRRVNRSGVISTYAGGGDQLTPPDGTPASRAIVAPTSVSVDRNGTLFILDRPACVIYRVTTDARIFRHAGKYLECGSSGDGGPARSATIHPPGILTGAIGLDPKGNLYLAEPQAPEGAGATGGGRVRVIDAEGVIRPFAGNGKQGFATDFSSALSAPLFSPQSVLSDGGDGMFIGDGPFIYAVSTGLILRVAGDLGTEESGDGGPARNARLFGPTAMDADTVGGQLVFVDFLNRRVRGILVNPPAQTVTPALLSFSGASGGAPAAPQNMVLSAAVPGVVYSARVTGPPAPWLRVAPETGTSPRLIEVTADPAELAPGLHTAEITVETPLAAPVRRTVAVTFRVGPAVPPKLTFDTGGLSFTVARGSAARIKSLLAINSGGGAAEFTVSAAASNGGRWLSAVTTSARVRPGQPASISVTADPSGLAPGTYIGRVTASGSGGTVSIPVTLTVSANDRAIELSQSGLSFTTVSGGSGVPPRAFEVLSIGRGAAAWTASVSTLEGGSWLNVSRTSGSSDAGATDVPSVDVNVSQTGLAPGAYYGLVRVDAPGAANSPQYLTIGHEVLPPGSDPGALVDPSELVFTTAAGGSPSSKDAFVYNVAQPLKTFRSTGELAGALLVTLPKDQTLELGRPTRLVVQPFVSSLAAGVYTGAINLQFTDGRVRLIRVRVIVTGVGGRSTSRGAEGCAPTKLLPAMTSISGSTQITAGWPVALNVEVADDCGGVQDAGSVVVSFSNGDAPVPLQPLKNGRWAGTWASRGSAENTTVKVEAQDGARSLAGTNSVTVGVRSQQAPPAVSVAGVVSAAGFQSFAPLTPGGMISIFGERLADATVSATGFPLPTRLSTTRLLLGGRDVPLLFVSPGQINALVPSGIEVNTRHQLLIQRGTTLSAPVPLDVATAQPGVFKVDSGSTQGHVYWVRPGSAVTTPTISSPDTPARAGDVIIIYGSGLGATVPEVPAGQQAPSTQPSPITGAVSVRLGDVPAPVEFAGLVAGFGGLYQINARVPAGVTGDAVPVVVSLGDLVSPPVTMAVR